MAVPNKNTRSTVFCGKKTTIVNTNNVCGPDRFAPVRPNNIAESYCNGKEYMEALYKHITELPSGCIMYIADWAMDLSIHLIRTDTGVDKKSKLADVLVAAAKNNIQIRVLLYDCPQAVYGTKDLETEAVLESILGNSQKFNRHIRVIRHRPSLTNTHHQKFVVTIDPAKKIVVAYLGGLDLTWGRWDTAEHPLTDESDNPDEQVFIGDDYFNPAIYKLASKDVKRNKHPRMPWHDVHMKVEGEAARDVERNFVERWNHHRNSWTFTDASEQINKYLPKYVANLQRIKNKGYDKNAPEYIEDIHGDEMPNPKNIEFESFDDQAKRIEEYLNHKPKVSKEKELTLSNFKISTIGKQSVQIIRSINKKSGGDKTESHIHEAMINAIRGAQNYIYVETQYLVGSYSRNAKNDICTEIVKRILRAFNDPKKPVFRVYIVFPVHPDSNLDDSSMREFMYWQWQTVHRKIGKALDEDSGDIEETNILDEKDWGGMIGALIKGMGLTNEKKYLEEISTYLNVFNLRNHGNGKLGNEYVTEQIYIHAKMMIVDDRIAIIGTANVNDRSLMGEKDSEIAAIVFDREEVDGKMNGKNVKVRKFAKELRLKLWSEHLWGDIGETTNDAIQDPIVDKTHNFILGRANSNTEAFEKAFPGIPSNLYQTIEKQQEAVKTRKHDNTTKTEIKNITGHLVNFPYKWLWVDHLVSNGFIPDSMYAYNLEKLNTKNA